MKKIVFPWIMLIISSFQLNAIGPDTDTADKTPLNSVAGTESILLTYPRSGTNWTIGILQALCKRPVVWFGNRKTINRLGFEIDDSLQKIYRTHSVCQQLKNLNQSSFSLIFTLRNFKECIIKQTGYTSEEFLKALHENDYEVNRYFNNLIFFDSGWKNPKTKHLIVYEAMIKNPQTAVISLLNFLGEDLEKVPEFFEHYDEWNEAMLASYHRQHARVGAASQNNLIFHSKDFPKESLRKMDEAVKERYPVLWDKYLKRYAEKE